MNEISGVTFDHCYSQRVEAAIGGVCIPFISRQCLLLNKQAAVRSKDLADIEALTHSSQRS